MKKNDLHGPTALPWVQVWPVRAERSRRIFSSRDVVCIGRGVVDSVSALLHPRLQRRGAFALVGVRALHHRSSHGLRAELLGGEIADGLDELRRQALLQVRLEPREVLVARVGFAFAQGDLALFAVVQCCTPATHNQLELIDSFPAIDRDGALSRRRIVASAECAHEPLQCSLRTHFHARMSCTRPTL